MACIDIEYAGHGPDHSNDANRAASRDDPCHAGSACGAYPRARAATRSCGTCARYACADTASTRYAACARPCTQRTGTQTIGGRLHRPANAVGSPAGRADSRFRQLG